MYLLYNHAHLKYFDARITTFSVKIHVLYRSVNIQVKLQNRSVDDVTHHRG